MKKKPISRQAKHMVDLEIRHRINAGREVVKEQGAFFARHFGQVSSEWKKDLSRVTFADIAISENIFSTLIKLFPKDNFCSEEMSTKESPIHLNGDFSWILDPVDGTNNYALGFPLCAISLALLYEGMPIYGILYDYSIDSVIEGGAGHGLHQNNQALNLISKELRSQEIVGMQFPLEPKILELCAPILEKFKIRAFGSSALLSTWVAKGYLWGAIDTRSKVWDIAASYAFAEAVGNSFNFIEKSPFPLNTFHTSIPKCPYFTGDKDFFEEMEGILI